MGSRICESGEANQTLLTQVGMITFGHEIVFNDDIHIDYTLNFCCKRSYDTVLPGYKRVIKKPDQLRNRRDTLHILGEEFYDKTR